MVLLDQTPLEKEEEEGVSVENYCFPWVHLVVRNDLQLRAEAGEEEVVVAPVLEPLGVWVALPENYP